MRFVASRCAARLGAVLALSCLTVGLSSCTIQLAPTYDAGIVTGLNTANTQTETLFATVSSGVTKETFATREPQYNAIIGQFSALDLQVAARPMPQPPSFLMSGPKPLPPSDPKLIPLLTDAPTKAALDHIVATLTQMRNLDAQAGLAGATCPATPSPAICGFKSDYEQNFDSALTYETALQR